MITPHQATGARIALVTGRTRGVGAAVVERLLDRGWSAIGFARRPAAFEHDRYRHLAIDLAEAATLAETIEREVGASLSDGRWTRIGLVNNAASSGALGPIESTDPAALLHHAAVNWVAPAWSIGFVLRRTPPQTPLRIVNVSSGAAVGPFPGLSDYCASKAALRMSGMVAAAELDSPLRPAPARPDTAILSYEPGTVDTAIARARWPFALQRAPTRSVTEADQRPTRIRMPASNARTAMSGYGNPRETNPATPVRISQIASSNMPTFR